MNGNLITLIVVIIIGIIVFIVTLDVFRRQMIFGPFSSFVISLCVSLLSLIGIYRMLMGGDPSITSSKSISEGKWDVEFILLPYIVLGIMILLIYILSFLTRKPREKPNEKPSRCNQIKKIKP